MMEKTFRVLAIGNSFSEDAMRYLYPLAREAGFHDVRLGNLFIGGCSLEKHAVNARYNLPAYKYQVNTTGAWYDRPASIADALEEKWDIVTLQQVSSQSGQADSYNENLDFLIQYIQEHKSCSDTRIAWHMTWAEQAGSTHPGFAYYGCDQGVMYRAIINAVQNRISCNPNFHLIIPTGTAIQNLRTVVGDTLTRDGFHLSDPLGRLTASMTWLYAISGRLPSGIHTLSTIPGAEKFQPLLTTIHTAVKQAIAEPYMITDLKASDSDNEYSVSSHT